MRVKHRHRSVQSTTAAAAASVDVTFVSSSMSGPEVKHCLQPRIAENGYRLPDPLPIGSILTDSTKRQWLLGHSIGCGGFGEIYCAQELPDDDDDEDNNYNNDHYSMAANNHHNGGDHYSNTDDRPSKGQQQQQRQRHLSYKSLPKRSCVRKFNRQQLLLKRKKRIDKLLKDKQQNYPFVAKVDHLSGPLFAEMHFYHRVAKPKLIDNWMLTNRLAFIGMPRYVASGIFISRSTCRRFRFLVLDRMGVDLQKILDKHRHILSLKSAYTITTMIIDILAYIHSFGYIHADIKASNLLLGRTETTSPARELYLVDYGLVERYRTQNGEHKEEEEDNRRANSGTIEFTSRDGHVGALTRRSDLEMLVYNTITWLSGGRLPWIDEKDYEVVRQQKEYYMSHIDKLLIYAFKTKSSIPKGLDEFVRSIGRLGFKEDPDYGALKLILIRAIVSSGYTNDGLITWGNKSENKTNRKGAKRCASADLELAKNNKQRKQQTDKQEFEQIESCDIPRKMDRHRAVRSAPTTCLSPRHRSGGSMTPAVNGGQLGSNGGVGGSGGRRVYGGDIELSNPTPQMLEVMERIRQKSANIERVFDSFDLNTMNNAMNLVEPKIHRLKVKYKKKIKKNKTKTNSSNNGTNNHKVVVMVNNNNNNKIRSTTTTTTTTTTSTNGKPLKASKTTTTKRLSGGNHNHNNGVMTAANGKTNNKYKTGGQQTHSVSKRACKTRNIFI
ncbi:probable serine/threonine-protein kinase DDB_G0292354 [Oppia nitens]|uniref:probable serine/threonine-protein kinase DDB_G0292354 n=1 Tax=Oppia nitens TaxID=1686743 RepID=UPI0023D9B3EB|nr:probable serine/threonine-protein kinase DDB_G0292354 [Oppia nitens]